MAVQCGKLWRSSIFLPRTLLLQVNVAKHENPKSNANVKGLSLCVIIGKSLATRMLS